MTLTRTALEREMLLVAVPDAEAGEAGSKHDPQEALRLQERFDHTGHLGRAPKTHRSATVVRVVLAVVALVSIGMVVQLALVSKLEHRSAQASLYNQFRTEVALGTGPLGPRGPHHTSLALGEPMAQITIPAIGVSQVVLEGTTGSVLADGPGHERSTVFPGGTGDSIILGRAAAYGGPFGRISQLHKGDRITVITQVGTSVFKVIDVRPAGAKVRPVARGASRLTLGTASGTEFVPSGVVWVDADKIGSPLAAQKPLVKTVPASEQPLGFDTSTLLALSLWTLLLVVLVVAGVWTWRRRGRAQAWIVFTAPVLLVWMFVADQFARLLPNLL
jgi:sortase A